MLGDSLGSNNGKLLGFDDIIKLLLYDGKVIVTKLGNIDEIKLGIDVGTELRYLDG